MPINAHIQVHVLYLYKHTCIYIYVERDLLGQNLLWDETSIVRGQGSDIISRMKSPDSLISSAEGAEDSVTSRES